MLLTLNHPWNEFDHLLSFNGPGLASFRRRPWLTSALTALAAGERESSEPEVHAWETDVAYLIKAKVPGLTAKDVEVTIEASALKLSLSRDIKTPEGFSNVRQERTGYTFARTFELAGQVDADKVTATLKDGLLTVTAPKTEAARPRRIEVQS